MQRNLSSGNYNIINESKIEESIKRVLNSRQYNCYSSPKGIKQLRIKISEQLNNMWDFKVNYNNMIITTGSQQSINLLAEVLLNAQNSIMIEQPTYYGAINVFRNKKINMIGIDIFEEGIYLKQLQKQLKQSKCKFIYVVPTFNNPTGYSWSNENRRKFLDIVNKYDLTVIEDDPYSMINFKNEKYESLYKMNNGKNVIYLGTFSKLISPSVNVGYILANEETTTKLYQYKESDDLCTSLFNQYVILDYLTHNNLENEVKQKIPQYIENLEMIQKSLLDQYGENIEITVPKGGLFFLIKFKN